MRLLGRAPAVGGEAGWDQNDVRGWKINPRLVALLIGLNSVVWVGDAFVVMSSML